MNKSGTQIDWLDRPGFKGETLEVTRGCTHCSKGCDNCYAMRWATTRGRHLNDDVIIGDQWSGNIVLCPEALDKPLHWRAPRTIFVNSRSDLFHPKVPFEFVYKVLAVAALTLRHTYIIVTKRAERMAECFADLDVLSDAVAGHMLDIVPRPIDYASEMGAAVHRFYNAESSCLPNVWLIATCCTQEEVDRNVPHLLKCPAAVRGISLEPLLEGIDLTARAAFDRERAIHEAMNGPAAYNRDQADSLIAHPVDWVIVGGESGPRDKVRPCDVSWIRNLRDQCAAAGVAFYLKQLGRRPEVAPTCPEDKGLTFAHTLESPKGSDPSEWELDLRGSRAWPEVKQ